MITHISALPTGRMASYSTNLGSQTSFLVVGNHCHEGREDIEGSGCYPAGSSENYKTGNALTLDNKRATHD